MRSLLARRGASAFLFVVLSVFGCAHQSSTSNAIASLGSGSGSSSSPQTQTRQRYLSLQHSLTDLRGGSTFTIPTSSMIATAEDTTNVQTETRTSHQDDDADDDNKTRVVFSDVDGTLVHYPNHVVDDENADNDGGDGDDNRSSSSMIYLPPSSTGMRGIISSRTFRLAQRLREEGCIKLVLVSGMRGTTLFKRLPYLPRADAYACDAGGRIFYLVHDVTGNDDDGYDGPIIRPVAFQGASDTDLTPFGIQEDTEWKSRIQSVHAAGLDGYNDAIPIQEKRGLLWDFAKKLMSDGYVVDYKGYASCFRVNRKQQTDKIDDAKFASLLTLTPPDGIATSVNLGCVDFYPTMSGKKNCCQYLVGKFSPTKGGVAGLSKSAVCICDDDNDLEMALACKHAFIPGVTSESMAKTIANNPGRFTVTEDAEKNIIETAATEDALNCVLEMLAKEQ